MSRPLYTNQLIHEESPYLLQHAHNPVHWYPWGEEAFSLARKQDKPVFLSIGYATCHWCHVMEKESFEDTHTAHILNENFLAIKLDREERPDIDHIYMRSLQAMGQQGGWPLNIFLTPEKLAITGGTYFPPVKSEAMYGRPSFVQVLEAVNKAWKSDRAKLLKAAQSIYVFLQQREEEKKEDILSSLGWEDIEKSALELKKNYDPYRGGFVNNGPNKFPPSLQILFLTAYYRKSKDKEALEMIENTLEQIKRGGIYDQIGGGLSRYSTDHDWLVPHFEKMLYDNALFLWAITESYRITQKEKYRSWALDIFAYIQRDMTSEKGAFFCAQDADSEGEEGKFYIWSLAEFQKVLEEAAFSLEERKELVRFWALSARGNFENCNILHEPLTREQFVKTTKYSKEEWESLLLKARKVLLEKREKRVRPLCDDKIVTAWNAYMVSALAQASRAFALPDLALAAQRCADFLWEKLYSPKEGELLRRFRKGKARFAGGLQDYAALACAFLDLYRANFNPENIERAVLLGQKIIKKFSMLKAKSAFYDSAEENEDLILRMLDPYDGVEPSGNALAARLFYTLSRYGIQANENRKHLKGILNHFSTSLKENGTIHCFLLYVYCHFLEGPFLELTILDDSEGEEYLEETRKTLCWFNEVFSGESIIALANQNNLRKAAKHLPLLAHRSIYKAKSSIYLCNNLSCQKEVHNLDALISLYGS